MARYGYHFSNPRLQVDDGQVNGGQIGNPVQGRD
jgi:hypothetical protein